LQISHLVIAKGKLGVSTKEAYQAVDSLVAPKHPPVQEMRQLLKQGEPVEKIAPLCGNLFETAISLPEIHRIRTVMLEQGAWTSVMTGSGSAVFGIFPEEETAIAAGDALRKADVDFVQVLSQKERVLSYEPITHR
jgi:4-diphosphocytidyl-2-C-methyl-D-erythritol kinase